MQIISKFHDYYDTVQGLGFDSELRYIRSRKVVSEARACSQHSKPWVQLVPPRLRLPIDLSTVVVVVGDFMYHGFIAHKAGQPDGYLWSAAALEKWAVANIPDRARKDWFERLNDRAFQWDTTEHSSSALAWLGLDKHPTPPDVIEAMRIVKAPVVALYPKSGEIVIEVNGILRELEFYRRLDAQATFQEISMWIGTNLTSASTPPIAISDKVRIAQHGFTKCSFRRCKT